MALYYPTNLSGFVNSNKKESNQDKTSQDGASMMHFKFFERPDSQSSIYKQDIYLYMPDTISNNTNTGWEQAVVGRIAHDIKEGNKSLTTSVADEIKSGTWITRLTNNMAGENRVSYAQQKIINPYIAMTFTSVGFRQFELNFRFTPHNAQESKVIHKIIKEFRMASLPYRKSGHFTYPSEIEIDYLGRGKKWLFKYKRCVLTNVDVNYAGNGSYAEMVDGFPALTDLRLQFSENEIITAEDVEQGF